jgi:hypothetical protein
MKYIKIFENINKPQINDYIICNEKNFIKINKLIKFISSNIGQIIDIGKTISGVYYTVKYNNYNNIKDLIESSGLRNIYLSEILYFSPNIEDVESYIKIKKYNL